MGTTQNLAGLENELNAAILSGKSMEAFERFYADDVTMQENTEAPTVGKDKNRERELAFLAQVEAFHDGKLVGGAVGDDVTYSEWEFDVTMKGVGRSKMTQVAARRWKNGKVVHERFYYSRG